MARENKMERQVREHLTTHLEPNEALRHFTWGSRNSTSAIWLIFGVIGALIARQTQSGFFLGLTDRRLILVKVKGETPTGQVHSIPLTDVKGMKYSRGLYSGALNIYLIADKLEVHFDSRPWYPRAQEMAKLMPLQ